MNFRHVHNYMQQRELSEVSQTEENLKEMMQMSLLTKQKETHRLENKALVARGKNEGRG